LNGFANALTHWQGLLRKNKSGRFRQLDRKPNYEMRQYSAAPYSMGVFTHDGLPLGGSIALSLDALSSDKKMEFDLSQGGAFPAIDS
jgi:hypothetical protein